jgi:hypothetical protein
MKGWVTDGAAVLREWGNVTVKLGNSTWNLTNVYFDTPDPSRMSVFTTRTAPLDNNK